MQEELESTEDQPGQSTAETNGHDQELLEALQGWYRASDEARRYNRNVIQYGAGIAGAMGVGVGSGGLFAIAKALLAVSDDVDSLPVWVWGILIGVSYIASVLFVAMVGLLALAAWRRLRAEREATQYRAMLIHHVPQRFMPTRDELVAGAVEQQ